ncbi:type VI secretion system baseplate subunit TssF [Rugamonas sp. CCM 8940]|nr:type VI secretion system baseplate subunit TssF [Rugamonas sp. CCM 8940]
MPYYERELALMRRDFHGFAERYPAVAAALLIADESSKDPQVERLIQSFALLAARIAKRLDDDYPQLSDALLESLHPDYLRSCPSSSILQVDLAAARKLPELPCRIPRGTLLTSAAVQGVRCQFSTRADIVLTALSVRRVDFHPVLDAPAKLRLAADVGAGISIRIDCDGAGDLAAQSMEPLRLFIDGDPSFCGALRDTLFSRVSAAFVAFGEHGPWLALDSPPLAASGFAEEDALLPPSPRSHPAYRLLTEYFVFPEKFNFIELAWPDMCARMPAGCRSLTLHLALRELRADSHLAQTLGKLNARNLRLHCAPVVNLFPRPAVPIALGHTEPDYALLADAALPQGYEIHGVEAACLLSESALGQQTENVLPFNSPHHGQNLHQAGRYWLTRRDEPTAELSPGHEIRIALVDTERAPLAFAAQTLSLELLCSNRNLPAALAIGAPQGDLGGDGTLDGLPLRLLRKPSAARRFASGKGAHWRLVAQLSLNHRSLSGLGLDQFRQMLSLYDLPRSAVTQRQIQGVVDLRYQSVMAWIAGQPRAALMPGIQIRLTVDEDAFVGGGIHLFAQVLDRFFGLYSQLNVFSQLLVLSHQSGEELMRCQPRSGKHALA